MNMFEQMPFSEKYHQRRVGEGLATRHRDDAPLEVMGGPHRLAGADEALSSRIDGGIMSSKRMSDSSGSSWLPAGENRLSRRSKAASPLTWRCRRSPHRMMCCPWSRKVCVGFSPIRIFASWILYGCPLRDTR